MSNLNGTSTRSYIDLPWGQVHVRSAGDPGDRSVVFLHQSPLSSAIYEPVLEPLAARGFHAVALDTPGFGMSDSTDRPWSIEDYASGFWQAVDRLGIERLDIVGQHTGATVAVEAHLQQPGRAGSLVLQGLPMYSESEIADKKAGYAPGYVPSMDGSHLKTIWDRVLGLYPEISVGDANRQVLEYLCTGPDYATAYRAVFDYRLDVDRLQEAPIVFLHGARDLLDRVSTEIREAFPLAPFETVADGTDFVTIERPDPFVDALVGQLRRREGIVA